MKFDMFLIIKILITVVNLLSYHIEKMVLFIKLMFNKIASLGLGCKSPSSKETDLVCKP
jgi:hypothetical protein